MKSTWPHQDIKEFPVWRVQGEKTNLKWLLPQIKKGILIEQSVKRFLKDVEK